MGLTLFYQFLTVRILERIQQISKEICRGCEMHYRLASLHPCETNSLFQRVDLFLPSVKAEALDKIVRLVQSFKANFPLFYDEDVYLEIGNSFLQTLQPQHLIDTRYINEESDSTFGLDSSWREPEIDTLTQICNDVFGETDVSEEKDQNDQEEILIKRRKTIPKPRKMNLPKQVDELIAEGRKKTSIIKPSRPLIGRKSIHKVACDDPSCCKDTICY